MTAHSPRARWKYAWFQRSSFLKSLMCVRSSISRSSSPAISARSTKASLRSAREKTGGGGPPATSTASAAAAALGSFRPRVVRVVLHERRAAGEPSAHHLGDPDEGRGLPVTLSPEPVAVGHQALHGDAGQLRSAVEGRGGVGGGV